MIPGKRYTPEAILRIVWRRKWVIVLPFVLIAGVTAAVSRTLPNRYRSDTSSSIVPQQIPEDYVQPTVTPASKIGWRPQSADPEPDAPRADHSRVQPLRRGAYHDSWKT